MSLGDLVISLSCNTASLQSDMGKAQQVTERVMASIIRDAKGAERAIDQLSRAGMTSTDRLQKSFNNLNIKSGLQIENEKNKLIASFEQIKNSGVASANEIKRAHIAMKASIEGLENGTSHAHVAFNAFSLSSIVGLAKIQLMYQAVNAALTTLIALPGKAIDAMEAYNVSAVKTAALLVSFNAKNGNIAEQYKNARDYALGLTGAMVDIDKASIASTKQLALMNTEFQKARVFLDPTKGSQVKGFTSVSNVLAVVASGSQNPDLQYSQEIKGLMSGEEKTGNALFGIFKSIDPLLKEHLETWKKTDTVFENLGRLAIGFEAASGDIASLWSTISSTFSSLYEEVIRDGMKSAFEGMVSSAQKFNDWIDRHKVQLSQGVHKTWLAVMGVVESVVIIFKGFGPVLSPMLNIVGNIFKGWGLIAAVALPTVVEKLMNVVKIGGAIVMMVGSISGAFISFIGSLGTGIVSLGKAAFQALTGDFEGAGKTLGSAFEGKFADSMVDMVAGAKGALLSIGEEGKALFDLSNFDKRMNAWNATVSKHKAISPPKVDPVAPKEETVKIGNYNEVVGMFNSMQIQAEQDELARKLLEIETRFSDLMVKFNAEADKASLAAQGITAITIANLKEEIVNRTKLQWFQEKEKEYQKAVEANNKNLKALRESELADKMALIAHEEALNKISGPEATARKLETQRELVNVQKESLSLIQKSLNPEAWIAQQKEIVKTQREVEKLNKILYDRTTMGGFENFMTSMRDSASNTGAQVKNVLEGAFNGALDALMNFTETGKFAFHDFATAILKDIERIMLQKALAGIVENATTGIGSLFGATSAPTSTWNGVSAGNVGAPAFSMPSFDVGTNYVPKDMIAQIHKGEKIVPAAYNRADDMSNVKIEIINQSGTNVKAKDGGTKFDGKNMVKTLILEALDEDWTFRNAVRGS